MLESRARALQTALKNILDFLNDPVKGITKPNSDPKNRYVYDADKVDKIVDEAITLLRDIDGP